MKIVALSDQHGFLPDVPVCDLLLVAGDVCPDRIGQTFAEARPDTQMAWFDEHARPWLLSAPATHKILTWGNHDWCGQASPARPETPATHSPSALHIVVDAAVQVPVPASTGRAITVWGTPWTRQFGRWAFMKDDAGLAELYASIPSDVDILLSHQPPYGYGDRFIHPDSDEVEHLGSRALLETIRRIRPRLVVCGHLHEGYGRYEYEGVPIYNVSVVNDDYQLVRPPTVIDIADW